MKFALLTFTVLNSVFAYSADLPDSFVGNFRSSACPVFPAAEQIQITRTHESLQIVTVGDTQPTNPIEISLQDVMVPPGDRELIKYSEGLYSLKNEHLQRNAGGDDITLSSQILARSPTGNRVRYSFRKASEPDSPIVCVFYSH